MAFIIENIRLRELVTLVRANRAFFDEFMEFLKEQGFATVLGFVQETSDERAFKTILSFLRRNPDAVLLDGVSQPYTPAKAKWYFLSWLFRDAPAQRLGPMLPSMPGDTLNERKAYI